MFLIKGGLVKTMAGKDIPNGEVLVDGGKIKQVGKNIKCPKDTKVIDATGCIVTPGIIDAHTHIGLLESTMRWEGSDVNERAKPVTPNMQAIDGINPADEGFLEARNAGITSVCVAPGSANVIGGYACAIKTVGSCVDDMLIRNPVAMKAAFGENPKSCHGQTTKQSPVTRMATAALLRATLSKAIRYNEDILAAEKDSKKNKPAIDPEMEAMLPVVRKEIPLKVHAHRADDILTAIRIAQEFDLKITLDHCTEGHVIVDKLAQYNYPALIGPSATFKSKPELSNKTFKTPGILQKAGITVCIITDAPITLLHHLPIITGIAIKGGLPEEEAWKAITINPAKVLGIDDKVGSLEKGKDADILIFKENPLRVIQAEPEYVFINGVNVKTQTSL